jgi:hypothetical protein
MILNLLDPFLASRLDLVSRNDGYSGEGYTYGRLYNITTCYDLMALYSVTHHLDFMLTTIPPSSDITSKGSFESEPSLRTASRSSELAPEISWDSIIGRTGRSRRRST